MGGTHTSHLILHVNPVSRSTFSVAGLHTVTKYTVYTHPNENAAFMGFERGTQWWVLLQHFKSQAHLPQENVKVKQHNRSPKASYHHSCDVGWVVMVGGVFRVYIYVVLFGFTVVLRKTKLVPHWNKRSPLCSPIKPREYRFIFWILCIIRFAKHLNPGSQPSNYWNINIYGRLGGPLGLFFFFLRFLLL